MSCVMHGSLYWVGYMTTMAIGQITHLAMMPWVGQPIPEHSILVVASKCCLVGICFRLLVALIAFTVH